MPSNSYFTSLFFFSGHCFRTLISHVQMEIDQWGLVVLHYAE